MGGQVFRCWFAFFVLTNLLSIGATAHASLPDDCPPCIQRDSTGESCPRVVLDSGRICYAALTSVKVNNLETGEARRLWLFAIDDCPGDINGDGQRNFSDLLSFKNWFLRSCPPEDYNCRKHDLDHNGTVNFSDLNIFRTVFLQDCC